MDAINDKMMFYGTETVNSLFTNVDKLDFNACYDYDNNLMNLDKTLTAD